MAGQKITLSEALGWAKQLGARRGELTNLRNQSAKTVQQRYGGKEEPINIQTPVYDAIKLDKAIGRIQREERLLDAAIKRMNAKTPVEGYELDDSVLGELEDVTVTKE